MELIAHRINTQDQLKTLSQEYGVEVDIRSNGDQLYIHHDPFKNGELFEEWIQSYRHGTLILNVKEEGLEQALIDIMKRHKIKDFFFLDQSFPFLMKWANKGEKRCAVRVSEFESIDSALTLSNKVNWVWVDCFNHFPLDCASATKLKEAKFKLCLVSPELQGRDAETEIPQLQALLVKEAITVDAVCTKRPDLWTK